MREYEDGYETTAEKYTQNANQNKRAKTRYRDEEEKKARTKINYNKAQTFTGFTMRAIANTPIKHSHCSRKYTLNICTNKYLKRINFFAIRSFFSPFFSLCWLLWSLRVSHSFVCVKTGRLPLFRSFHYGVHTEIGKICFLFKQQKKIFLSGFLQSVFVCALSIGTFRLFASLNLCAVRPSCFSISHATMCQCKRASKWLNLRIVRIVLKRCRESSQCEWSSSGVSLHVKMLHIKECQKCCNS